MTSLFFCELFQHKVYDGTVEPEVKFVAKFNNYVWHLCILVTYLVKREPKQLSYYSLALGTSGLFDD